MENADIDDTFPLVEALLGHPYSIDIEKLSHYLGIAYCKHLNTETLPFHIIHRISYSFLKTHKLIPIQENAKGIHVAVSHPLKNEVLEEVRWLLNNSIIPIVAPENEIQKCIEHAYHQKQDEHVSYLKTATLSPSDSGKSLNFESIDLLDNKDKTPVIKLLNFIIQEAISQQVSDIHFEPFEEMLHVRYRLDGMLQKRYEFLLSHTIPLLMRIKVMAQLDIAETRLPQDGRIKLKMGEKEVDFRVSTIPLASGERIVLRILDRANILLGLDEIGMPKSILQDFRQVIHKKEGIVLVTGPTGSGKTTTLYSALSELVTQPLNIMTIEDPVEYHLKGIAQIAVKPKISLTFAKGLRHILRQDPDIIMVGEIRDLETAQIAIQAALTGHLVLSTLHTNDSVSAITRLVEMGIEPYLLSSSLLGAMAQRLVRKICSYCHGQGCTNCFETGFQGRVAIYEWLQVSKNFRRAMAESQDSSMLKIRARKLGLKTLFEQGKDLVQLGKTTEQELLRVVSDTEEIF